jgi:hypothetical protein
VEKDLKFKGKTQMQKPRDNIYIYIKIIKKKEESQ